ncbi:hypothetical protein JCM5350_006441 [Sporobolomyces pararoseus]
MRQSPRISQHHRQREDQQPHQLPSDRPPWTDRARFASPESIATPSEESASNHDELQTSVLQLSANLWIAFEQLERAQTGAWTVNSAAHKQQRLQDRLLAFALLREIYLIYLEDPRRIRDARRLKDTGAIGSQQARYSEEWIRDSKRYFRPDDSTLSRIFELDARDSSGDARLYTLPFITEESRTAARQTLHDLGSEYLRREQHGTPLEVEHTRCALFVAGNCFQRLGYVDLAVRVVDRVTYIECYPEAWLGLNKVGRVVRLSHSQTFGNRSAAIYGESTRRDRTLSLNFCDHDAGNVRQSIE